MNTELLNPENHQKLLKIWINTVNESLRVLGDYTSYKQFSDKEHLFVTEKEYWILFESSKDKYGNKLNMSKFILEFLIYVDKEAKNCFTSLNVDDYYWRYKVANKLYELFPNSSKEAVELLFQKDDYKICNYPNVYASLTFLFEHVFAGLSIDVDYSSFYDPEKQDDLGLIHPFFNIEGEQTTFIEIPLETIETEDQKFKTYTKVNFELEKINSTFFIHSLGSEKITKEMFQYNVGYECFSSAYQDWGSKTFWATSQEEARELCYESMGEEKGWYSYTVSGGPETEKESLTDDFTHPNSYFNAIESRCQEQVS